MFARFFAVFVATSAIASSTSDLQIANLADSLAASSRLFTRDVEKLNLLMGLAGRVARVREAATLDPSAWPTIVEESRTYPWKVDYRAVMLAGKEFLSIGNQLKKGVNYLKASGSINQNARMKVAYDIEVLTRALKKMDKDLTGGKKAYEKAVYALALLKSLPYVDTDYISYSYHAVIAHCWLRHKKDYVSPLTRADAREALNYLQRLPKLEVG